MKINQNQRKSWLAMGHGELRSLPDEKVGPRRYCPPCHMVNVNS